MERATLGLLFILTILGTSLATISNLRLCGDPKCKEPVSKGVTLLSYPSNDKHILSFHTNAEVIIYSKEAGTRPDLWGVEIKGKRGYVPKEYVREHKIWKSDLKYEVPTEPYAKQHEDNSGKQNVFPEDSSQNKVITEEEKNNEKVPVPESVAITAEDIEYNNIVELDTKDEHHPESNNEKKAPLLSSEESTNSEADQVTSRENETGEKSRESEISEHEEKEEKEEEKDIVEEESTEKAAAFEATTATSNEKALKEDIVSPEGTAKVKEQNTKQKDTSDTQTSDFPQPSIVSEVTETATPLNEPENLNTVQLESSSASNYAADQNSVHLESSSVEFEIIDGTTIYFGEEVEATPTLPEVQNTVVPLDSSITKKKQVTVDPLSILPQSSMEIIEQEGNVNAAEALDSKEMKILDSASSTEVLEDVVKPSLIDPIPELPTDDLLDKESHSGGDLPSALDLSKLILPPETISEEQDLAVSDEVKDKLTEEQEPHVHTPTETVTEPGTDSISERITETSSEEEQEGTDFGTLKPDTVLDTEQAVSAETGGYFASWFGSSETAADDDGDDDDDVLSESDADENNELLNEPQVVESSSTSEESKATDAAETNNDSSTDVVPSDSVDVFVDESPDSSNVQDVDTVVFETQDSNPSSVENQPDSTASTSSTDQYTDTPHVPTDHTHIDLGGGNDDDTNVTDEGEADVGPSTARPLYAEPEPTDPTYSPRTNIDSDDMARLADKTDERTVINDAEDKVNSVEESLTQKFLKTSHNLLLSLAGAVQLPEGLAFGVEAELAEPVMSSGMVVLLGIVVATVITIYLIHLFMVKSSRESPMLSALNKMERESRIINAENASLHEQLILAQRELETVSSRVNQSSGDINDLDSHLEVIKGEYASEKTQFEEKIVQLEHELEEATTNGEEMHKMLSEMLSAQKDTSSFQASVDHLQGMLDGQREKVETLNNDLALKTRLNEELHSELAGARECVTKLDNQVQQLTQSLKEFSSTKGDMNTKLENESKMVKDLEKINKSLTKQVSDYDINISSMNNELKALQDTIVQLRDSIEVKDSELQVTKECLKQLRLTSDEDLAAPDDEKLSSIFDAIRVKAELQRVIKDRNEIEEQLHDAEMAQKNLEDAMLSIRMEVTDLRTQHDEAVHVKQEALSKLAVLSKYFEEKEAQLTKKFESQEELRVGAEGAAAAGASKIHNFGLEVSTYKSTKTQPVVNEKSTKFHPKNLAHYTLADLSPTTGNVPVSDEYKVEWVKAKAEMRRREYSTSYLHTTNSSFYPPSSGLPGVATISSHSATEKNTAHQPGVRPSSLIISSQAAAFTSEHLETQPSDEKLLNTISEVRIPSSQSPCYTNNGLDDTSAGMKELNREDFGMEFSNSEFTYDKEYAYRSIIEEKLRETPASDDVKSSVAAMKLLYERHGSMESQKDDMNYNISESTKPKASKLPQPISKIEDYMKDLQAPKSSQMNQGHLGKKKAQCDSLRKELEEQENSYKAQIASYEQKAHDNWLQARATERRFEEQRQENSQLRTRLTVMQKERDETHIHSSISKPTPKRVDANGSMSSPVEGEVDRNHRDVDSPPVVSHPLHAPPPMLPPMMFPPGAPPHALPPGVPLHPGLPGVPPPHGLPPPPFLAGEAPFMGPLPPLPGDRRLPPAGGMSSPPYRRSGSPSYDHHNDRYSPASEHSHFLDRRYSPPPIRHRPGSPDSHRRNHSPDRRSDRTRSPDHRSDHMRSPDHRSNRRTPDRRLDRRSPDRHFPTRSPDGYSQHRSSPHHYFDHTDYNSDESRIHSSHRKGKKTSTPLTSSDRWKNDS